MPITVDETARNIQVFYNSACPVCNAGITAQKDKMASCPVQWRDVNTDTQARREMPGELEFVRKRLHAIDEHGNINVGIDAFILIWRKSPKELWKAKLVNLPVIKSIAVVTYNVFAALLYRWNLRKGHWKIK